MSNWQAKIDRLSPETKADYEAYNILKATQSHGQKVGELMECEKALKDSGDLE
jgi:hypothetical protein